MSGADLYCLCVIPARGGSEGLPGKNLAKVGGKSLVRRAVEAAINSCRCSQVLCSTDSDAIADEAVRAGAVVPFRRPAEFASNTAATIDVVIHAVTDAEARLGRPIDLVCTVEPTTPMRTGDDIRAAVDLLVGADPPADSAVSICEVTDAHPAWLRKIDNALMVAYFSDLPEPTRRQDLTCYPVPYRRNGAVYVSRRDVVMGGHSLYGRRCIPYVMPPERSINIDTELDLICARAVWEHLSHHIERSTGSENDRAPATQ